MCAWETALVLIVLLLPLQLRFAAFDGSQNGSKSRGSRMKSALTVALFGLRARPSDYYWVNFCSSDRRNQQTVARPLPTTEFYPCINPPSGPTVCGHSKRALFVRNRSFLGKFLRVCSVSNPKPQPVHYHNNAKSTEQVSQAKAKPAGNTHTGCCFSDINTAQYSSKEHTKRANARQVWRGKFTYSHTATPSTETETEENPLASSIAYAKRLAYQSVDQQTYTMPIVS